MHFVGCAQDCHNKHPFVVDKVIIQEIEVNYLLKSLLAAFFVFNICYPKGLVSFFTFFEICDPILENQPYRGIVDFEIWPCKVTAGVLGQKLLFALA